MALVELAPDQPGRAPLEVQDEGHQLPAVQRGEQAQAMAVRGRERLQGGGQLLGADGLTGQSHNAALKKSGPITSPRTTDTRTSAAGTTLREHVRAGSISERGLPVRTLPACRHTAMKASDSPSSKRTAASQCLDSNDETRINHSLMKEPNGGTPVTARADRANSAAQPGAALHSPRSSESCFVPAS